jgi:hypothetical protein
LRDDIARHIVLHLEKIGCITLEAIGPSLDSCVAVHQMRRDSDLTASLAHLAAQNIVRRLSVARCSLAIVGAMLIRNDSQ